MDKVNTAHAQLQGVPRAAAGMLKDNLQYLVQRDRVAGIDVGDELPVGLLVATVLRAVHTNKGDKGEEIAHRHGRPVTALAALRMDCSCNPRTGYTCPNCAKDSRGNTPRSTRSSSPRSPRQPRGFKSQLAQDLDAKYKEEGLDPMYCIYAVALAVNDIAPEQVLIDHDIKGSDMFEHPDAGRHLYEAVRQSLPEYLPSGMDSSYSDCED